MEELQLAVQKAERNLNAAHSEFEQQGSTLAHEFRALKLQASIFQYDICVAMATVLRNSPKCFAESVALKPLVHHLYEYDQLLTETLIPRFLQLARDRDIPVVGGQVQELKRAWKKELVALRGWHDVRNKAAGHYDKDTSLQVDKLQTLNGDDVFAIARGFISFNMAWLKLLRDAGSGNDSTTRRPSTAY
jgi:hypothetical protein